MTSSANQPSQTPFSIASIHNDYRLELEGQSMLKIVVKVDDETPQA